MSQEDEPDLRTKLASELLRHAAWEDVRPHVIRQVVFVVRGLALVDVGEGLANDDRAKVATWIAEGTLARPTRDELERWASEHVTFATLIVTPFVLVQEESEPADQPIKN